MSIKRKKEHCKRHSERLQKYIVSLVDRLAYISNEKKTTTITEYFFNCIYTLCDISKNEIVLCRTLLYANIN